MAAAEVAWNAGHGAHTMQQSAPPTPGRDVHPTHSGGPVQILHAHRHRAQSPGEVVHHTLQEEGDISHSADTCRRQGEISHSSKTPLPAVSRLKAPGSSFSGSSVRNQSVSPSFGSAPIPKRENQARTGIPAGAGSDGDSSMMQGDGASRPVNTNTMWSVSRGPYWGSREDLQPRTQASARSGALGHTQEQAARELHPRDVPEGSSNSNPRSTLRISSGRNRERGRGRLSLLARRDCVTLAPTRPGLGLDHAEISSGCAARQDWQGRGEDWVPWEEGGEQYVSLEDVYNSSPGSVDSSLEVVYSSEEDTEWSEDVRQEDLDSSQEQLSPVQSVTHPQQGDMEHCSSSTLGEQFLDMRREIEQCSHTLDEQFSDIRRGLPRNSHKDRHNRGDCSQGLQGLNMMLSQTRNLAMSGCSREDVHLHQNASDEVGVMVSDCSTSFSQKNINPSDDPVTGRLTSHIGDGDSPLSFPVQPSPAEFTSQGTPSASVPSHGLGQGLPNPRPAEPNSETEDRPRETGFLQDAQNPQQQTGAAVPTYSPIHQQGASRGRQEGRPGQQRPGSLCRDVPSHIQESRLKNQPPHTYCQGAGYLEVGGKNSTPCMHGSSDGESQTILTGGEPSGLVNMSAVRSSRHTPTFGRPLQRQRAAVMRTSAAPLFAAVASPRQQSSPRKGIPLPHPHRGALLVYHNDVNRMMVVGNQCRQRPSTSHSHTPFPAASEPSPHPSLTTASCSAGLCRHARSLRDDQ